MSAADAQCGLTGEQHAARRTRGASDDEHLATAVLGRARIGQLPLSKQGRRHDLEDGLTRVDNGRSWMLGHRRGLVPQVGHVVEAAHLPTVLIDPFPAA
jgi:hypothetical protein